MMYARHELGIKCITCYAQPSIWKLDVLGVTRKARIRSFSGIRCIRCISVLH